MQDLHCKCSFRFISDSIKKRFWVVIIIHWWINKRCFTEWTFTFPEMSKPSSQNLPGSPRSKKKMQTNESKTCGRTCLNEYVYWAKKCYYKHFQNVWVEKRVQNCAFIMIFWNVCVLVYFWCEGAIMEVV